MINFTAWPEMLAWPYLMLNGWLPYRDIAIAHNPLLLIDLVIFYKIFGIGVLQLKFYTWILVAINAYLTYFVAKRLGNTTDRLDGKSVGVVSSLSYLLVCIVFQGNGLWFDLALTPFALLLYLFVKEKRDLLAGIMFALGFLTKQTFIYFLIPVVLSKITFLDIKKFALGCIYIFLPFLLILLSLGIIDDFYRWTIEFGIFFLPRADEQILFPTLKQFIFALLPFGIFLFNKKLLPWAIVGALGTYPRWELFHFQPALPFIAIALSSFLFTNKSRVLKIIATLLLIIFIVIGIKHQVGANTRFVEPEVSQISDEIKNSSVDEIYVVNYWDNIYELSDTLPVTKPLVPYIPWYLNYDNNDEKILESLKVKMPEVVIIGERDKVFPELYDFVDKFYSCRIVSSKIELCVKFQ